MNSVVIIIPSDFNIENVLKELKNEIKVSTNEYNQLILEELDKHAFLNQDDNIKRDYEDKELNDIAKIMRNPSFYLFEFNDFDFGKQILLTISNNSSFAIDDDFGNIYRGTQFYEKLKANPNWDWRSQEP